MSRSRLLALAMTTLVSGGVVMTSGSTAHAAGGGIRTLQGLGSLETTNTLCQNAGDGEGTFAFLNGPATPPLGTGSLRLTSDGTGESETGIWYSLAPGSTPAALSTFMLSSYDDVTAGAPSARVYAEAGAFAVSLPATQTWTSTDVLTASGTAYEFNENNTVSQRSATWSEFAAAHPSTEVFGLEFVVGCSPASRSAAYFDKVLIEANGSSSLYDFEAPIATALTMTGPTSIVAGQTATLGTKLTTGGAAMASRPVELWAKAYPATTYSKVATLTTSSTGTVSKAVRPLANTTYQWRFAGDVTYAPRGSVTKTLSVATRLTLNVHDTTMKTSDKLFVYGLTYPAKAGKTVSLVLRKTTGTVSTTSAVTRSDGSYGVVKGLTAGTYDAWATIPAVSGNAAGKSAVVRVYVT
jgi:hypothetical protein